MRCLINTLSVNHTFLKLENKYAGHPEAAKSKLVQSLSDDSLELEEEDDSCFLFFSLFL